LNLVHEREEKRKISLATRLPPPFSYTRELKLKTHEGLIAMTLPVNCLFFTNSKIIAQTIAEERKQHPETKKTKIRVRSFRSLFEKRRGKEDGDKCRRPANLPTDKTQLAQGLA